MNWLRNFGRKTKNHGSDAQPEQKPDQQPDKLSDSEMEKLLDSFMRTCWPTNYGDHTLGVDIDALNKLRGLYLDQAKKAILKSLEKSPHVNSIIAAGAIEMTEAVPIMTSWIKRIRSLDDKSESCVAYSRLAHSLYNFTGDEAYLTDLVEAVRVSGFSDIAGSEVIHCLWNVPLTIDALSAVWTKLKKRKSMTDDSSWRDNCEDFLREKLHDPVGRAFLSTLSDTEQTEVRSVIAMSKNQLIEQNRRFEQFVVERYNKGDLNKYGEYIQVGASPVPGLTLRCILEGHSKQVNSTSWSPDGNYLASAGSDNLVVIWDVKKGDCISVIEGGEIERRRRECDYHISHVAWSSDGEWIAFGSAEKNVSIWNVKKEDFLVHPKREGSTVRKLAWATGHNSLLYSYEDNTVWIRDIPSGRARQIFKGYSGRIDALSWSPDAAFIGAGYWDDKNQRKLNSGAEDTFHEVLLWDVEHERVVTKMVGHDSYINHISWMPNQPILAAASADSTISIWNLQERRQITSLESHAGQVEGVSFSAGGVLLASTAERDNMIHGTVRLWRTDTWQELIILKELGSARGALAFHPALPLLATRCHGNPEKTSMNHTPSSIRIWDLDFETFLRNPPFTDEFNRMEAEGHFASE